jgi:hypothetical protein
MQVQELFASWTKKRANDLQKAIGNIINDTATFKVFYEHPLIKNLKEPATGWFDELKRKIGIKVLPFKNPSYIPASTFATALFDVITTAGTSASPILGTFSALRKEMQKLEEGDFATANALLGRIDNLVQTLAGSQTKTLKTQLLAELNIQLSKLGAISVKGEKPLASFTVKLAHAFNTNSVELADLLKGVGPYIDQVRKGAMLTGSKELGSMINSLLAGAEEYATDADKALAIGCKNVETWFDNSMDRLSGWYKRWAQTWAFFIGLFFAVTLNVDSIDLAKHLWREPALRQALAANATKFITTNQTLLETEAANADVVKYLEKKFIDLNLPIGWLYETKPILKDETTNKPKVDIASNLYICPDPKTYKTYLEGISKQYTLGESCVLYNNLPSTSGEWSLKLLGIFLTSLAAMQGAPVWFDLLKKLVNVRSTGVNPTEKPAASTSDKER